MPERLKNIKYNNILDIDKNLDAYKRLMKMYEI